MQVQVILNRFDEYRKTISLHLLDENLNKTPLEVYAYVGEWLDKVREETQKAIFDVINEDEQRQSKGKNPSKLDSGHNSKAVSEVEEGGRSGGDHGGVGGRPKAKRKSKKAVSV